MDKQTHDVGAVVSEVVIPKYNSESARVDEAIAFCKSGIGRSVHAEEALLSAICRTNDCLWLNINDFPPPELRLIALSGPLGRRSIGYFENGSQMERGQRADSKAGYWQTLTDGPNRFAQNFIVRNPTTQATDDCKPRI